MEYYRATRQKPLLKHKSVFLDCVHIEASLKVCLFVQNKTGKGYKIKRNILDLCSSPKLSQKIINQMHLFYPNIFYSQHSSHLLSD